MDDLKQFLSQCGFKGLRCTTVKGFSPDDMGGAYYTSIDHKRITAIFGRPKQANSENGRFFYRVARGKALMIDTVKNRVVLSNSAKAFRKLVTHVTGPQDNE